SSRSTASTRVAAGLSRGAGTVLLSGLGCPAPPGPRRRPGHGGPGRRVAIGPHGIFRSEYTRAAAPCRRPGRPARRRTGHERRAGVASSPMSVSELLDLDATALARSLRAGDASPADVLDATLDAAEHAGAAVGAFTTLAPDLARTQALAAEAALVAARRDGTVDEPGALPPFLGVPCPVKDLTMVAGVPMRAGSAAIDPFLPPDDDGVVTLLRTAGTVMVGKTSTPELGLPCYTEPDVGPTARTPWDLARSAGGSSGGAAAAVAARVVPVAHGSDGGGSLRIPASACGLVGLKPSRGLVSPGPYGVDGAGLATHGVLTRTVRDAAAFLDVLAHPWPGDTFTARRRAAPSGRPLRVGLLLDPVIAADAPVHPACAGVARATAALLGELGHDVVEIPPPFAAERWDAFAALWSVGALQAPVPPDREHLLVP